VLISDFDRKNEKLNSKKADNYFASMKLGGLAKWGVK
jgi:hypothetical protein